MSKNWHYFLYNGFEFLVLGYDHIKQKVCCAKLICLTDREAIDLLEIVDTNEAQEELYLSKILNKKIHSHGGTWMDRLYPHVFFITLDQLARFIPGDQTQEFLVDQSMQNSNVETTNSENIEDILYGGIK